ncbi:MAG: hypothetical protein ACJAW7_003397 [Candidatus Azotimanducaceae bacterium]|jgi:hypothetical protein
MMAAATLTTDAAPDTVTTVSADAFFRQQADALVRLAQVFLPGGEGVSSTADH